MRLILCEKDRQAQRIAEALEIPEYDENEYQLEIGYPPAAPVFFDGNTIITALKGHLWNLSLKKKRLLYIDNNAQLQLPDLNAEYKETRSGKSRIELLLLLSERQWDDIVIATDHDREGALIGYEALQHAFNITQLDGIKRAHFTSLESSEIQYSFNHLVEFMTDKGFIDAGYCRSFLDAIWGINLTQYIQTLYRRAVIQGIENDMSLFRKLPLATLSSGRVQSPTLELINQNTTFAPPPEWHIDPSHCDDHDKTQRVETEVILDINDNLIALCTFGRHVIVDAIQLISVREEEREIECREIPFNTDAIIGHLAEKYSINPTQSMWFLETLYTEGYITYPRTDSEKIPVSQEKIDELLTNINTAYPVAERFVGQEPNEGSKEDEAHIAIIPTTKCNKESLDKLKRSNPTNYTILDEVIRGFLMCFGSPTEEKRKIYEFEIGEYGTESIHTYDLITTTEIEFGDWAAGTRNIDVVISKTVIYDYQELDNLIEKQEFPIDIDFRTSVIRKQGQVPETYFYNHKFIDEGQVVSKMAESGLGTKATRPGIYGMLSDRKYITTTPKMVLTTKIGNTILEFLIEHCPRLVDTQLTAELESNLNDVVRGIKTKEEVMEKGKVWLKEIFRELFAKEEQLVQDILDNIPRCEKCGQIMVFKHYRGAKSSIFLGCVGYEIDNCNSIMSV